MQSGDRNLGEINSQSTPRERERVETFLADYDSSKEKSAPYIIKENMKGWETSNKFRLVVFVFL